MSLTTDVPAQKGAAAARGSSVGPTRELARFVTGLTFRDLPPEVVVKVKNLLVDYYGCLVTTLDEDMAKVLFTVAKTEGVAAQPELSGTIAGLPGRYTTEWAAFVNGANTHLSELDDTDRFTGMHPGLGLWATALAMAERTHPTGEEFLTAVAAGYEVALRVALSVMPNHYVLGWNPSGTATMFGCAAIAAKLLGLDEERTAWALGLAGVQVAGNKAHLTERVMTKDFNNGHAARCGVNSGLLAQAGFSGSTDELENPTGFWVLYGVGSVHPEQITDELGSAWRVLGVGHKPYPSCRFIHSSLDAIIGLISDGAVKVEEIVSISTSLSAAGRYIIDDPEPWTEGKGTMGPRFSAQFNIAVAALYGRDGLNEIYDPEIAQTYLAREEVRHLMRAVTLVSDTAIDEDLDARWKCDLSVELADGRTERRVVAYPLGEPENDLGTEGLVIRFVKMTTMAGYWDAAKAERVAAELLTVDTLPDAGTLAAHYA